MKSGQQQLKIRAIVSLLFVSWIVCEHNCCNAFQFQQQQQQHTLSNHGFLQAATFVGKSSKSISNSNNNQHLKKNFQYQQQRTTFILSSSSTTTADVNSKDDNDSGVSTAAIDNTIDVSTNANTNLNKNKSIDWDALSKYCIAITIQMTLLYIVMYSIDTILQPLLLPRLGDITKNKILNFFFFYTIALKSRIFNPLSNTRPNPKSMEVTTASSTDGTTSSTTPQSKRIMPKWTPPGITFPIVWLLLIGPLRAITSSMIVSTTGMYSCIPIVYFLLHLSIGDVWNTINNIEQRYGTSVIGVLIVLLSKMLTCYQYTLVNTLAGKLLSLSLIWLTIASTLIINTWLINPNPITNQIELLYPTQQDKIRTKFVWFSSAKK